DGHAPARRRGDRWRHPGTGPGERAGPRRRFLLRTESGGMTLNELTIAEAGSALASRKISGVELATAHNDSIAALNPRLNAYITPTPEVALEHAKAADARIAAGTAGPLTG